MFGNGPAVRASDYHQYAGQVHHPSFVKSQDRVERHLRDAAILADGDWS